MRRWKLVALAAALMSAGCATPPPEPDAPAPAYTVVEPNASIPFGSSSVRSFEVGADGSLLLQATGGRWYRATLSGACRGLLPWEQAIGFPERAVDRVDKFTTVLIDGQRCAFRTFDEIADPKSAAAPAGAN